MFSLKSAIWPNITKQQQNFPQIRNIKQTGLGLGEKDFWLRKKKVYPTRNQASLIFRCVLASLSVGCVGPLVGKSENGRKRKTLVLWKDHNIFDIHVLGKIMK